jgi:hypothetical protein
MNNFDKWKTRYDNGWATEEQLQRLVVLGALTQAEYDLIIN